MINTRNINQRPVVTPDGTGQLIGVDDKANWKIVVVQMSPEVGHKLGVIRAYDIEEVEEVE